MDNIFSYFAFNSARIPVKDVVAAVPRTKPAAVPAIVHHMTSGPARLTVPHSPNLHTNTYVRHCCLS